MSQTTKYLIPFALVALAWLYVTQCHDPSVRKTALQVQQDQRDDSTHDANERWKAEFLKRDTLRDDSLARLNSGIRVARGEIARLKRANTATVINTATLDTMPRDSLVAIIHAHERDAARRDTLEAQQDTVIAQQDSALTLWAAMGLDRDERIAQLESENIALTRSRDAWKRMARGAKFGCVGGPSVTATLSGKIAPGFGMSCGLKF